MKIIVKTAEEIKKMREGGKKLAMIMKELEKMVKPGAKGDFLEKKAEELAFKMGGKPSFKGYKGFPSGLCFSINEEIVHAPPRGRILKKGDIVSLDFGLFYKGCYTDKAITCPVGRISSRARKLIQVTKKALDIGIVQARAGNYIGDISSAIQRYVESKGMSVVRELVGHGVGREVHEPPYIPNFGKEGVGPMIEEGMTFAIEPMVNLGDWKVELLADGWTFVTKDRSLSCHFEDTVLVTKKSAEILTR